VITHKSSFAPLDTFLFVGVGVGVAVNLASLSPKETVQAGADFVLSCFYAVTLFAPGLPEVSLTDDR